MLKGHGDGSVSPAKIYRGGTDEFSLAIADFTGDHHPEIIAVDQLENCLSLFLNDGLGNYDGPSGEAIGYLEGATNAPFPGSQAQSIDLNGDGKPDILLPESGPPNSPLQLTAILNDGTGNFVPPVRTPVSTANSNGTFPIFIAGNFRATIPDVIWANTFSTPNIVSYLPGKGDGTFGPPQFLAQLPNPLIMTTGDFNLDGKLDFAVIGGTSGGSWEIDVFLGHGDGTFAQLAPQTFIGFNGAIFPEQIYVGDFNRDGKTDILIGLNGNSGWESSGDDLLLAAGKGDGTFQSLKVLMPNFGAVAVGDVNNDGILDLIQKKDPTEDVGASLFFTPAVTVYLGQPDGSFVQQPTIHLPGVGLPSIAPVLLGDFNGDGNLDIAYRDFNTADAATIEPRLYVLQGNGDGTFFVSGHSYQLQSSSTPYMGADFNGDHLTDLVEMVGFTSSFHTIQGASPPAIDITMNSKPMIGNAGSATVTLNHPASSAQTVSLTTSDPAIQVPATLSFSAGEQTQQFNFNVGSGYDPTHIIAIQATLGTETAVAYTFKPNPNAVVGVTSQLVQGVFSIGQNTINVATGQNLPLILSLQSVGGYSGAFGGFQCIGLPTNATCSFPNSSLNLLPGGIQDVDFTINTTDAPLGTYSVQVAATDGSLQTSSTLNLGIGDFSISLSPPVLTMGPSGTATSTIISTATSNINGIIDISCSGLPATVSCGSQTVVAGSSNAVLSVNSSQLSPQDYPFQITGQIDLSTRTINATLRVGDFTASLDKETGNVESGPATFNLTLKSINHYSTNLTVSCQSPASAIVCSASPATVPLADGGTSTVVITVTKNKASAIPAKGNYLSNIGLSLCVLPLLGIGSHKYRQNVLLAIALIAFTGALSCGGGSSTSGSSGGGTSPSSPTNVNVPVVIQATSTANDFNNQKSVGPLVITP